MSKSSPQAGWKSQIDVGVGGLRCGWIFLYLLQLVSNPVTVLYQASIEVKNSQQLTKSAGLYRNEKWREKKRNCTNRMTSTDMSHTARLYKLLELEQ